MALHLVTGYSGKAHITSADQGALNAATFGRGNYVLNVGNQFAARLITNNSINILDGEVIMQGRHIRLESGAYEEVTIENGTQEYYRNDLICIRYTKDSATGIEEAAFVVIKGNSDASVAVDPAHNNGSILDGILTVDFPLYRVPLNGLNIGDLVPLFEANGSINERIYAVETGKVDKVSGKGLSTNDYSNPEKKQVADNKTDIANIKNGTIPAGKSNLAFDSEKLGKETAQAWQTKLDNIQTTSKAALSQAGWYRVAEYPRSDLVFGNSVQLIIKKVWNSTSAEFHNLLINTVAGGANEIKSLTSNVTNKLIHFTKARLVRDTTNAKSYIDVYYNASVYNTAFFELTHVVDGEYCWQAITPTLTEETVDGVTVITTYDIPTNASPVNSEDLAEGAYLMGAVGKNGYIAYPEGGSYITTSSKTGQLRITLPRLKPNTMIKFKVSIFNYKSTGGCADYIISGYCNSSVGWNHITACSIGDREDSKVQLPVYFGNTASNSVVAIGNPDTSWSYPQVTVSDVTLGFSNADYDDWKTGWNISISSDNSDLTVSGTVENPYMNYKYITTADLTTALAGYLKNTGGTVTGDLKQVSSTAAQLVHRFQNANRVIEMILGASGYFSIFDTTNGKHILLADMDGTNTFNGTATGNLLYNAKGSTQVLHNNVVIPFGIDSTDNNNALVAQCFMKEGVKQGYLGFAGVDKPIFKKVDYTEYPLLHTGNFSEYALSLSGGTVNGGVNVKAASAAPFSIDNTNGANVFAEFLANGVRQGLLGFNGLNVPVFYDTSHNTHPLLHSGNSEKVVVSRTPLTAEGSIRVW